MIKNFDVLQLKGTEITITYLFFSINNKNHNNQIELKIIFHTESVSGADPVFCCCVSSHLETKKQRLCDSSWQGEKHMDNTSTVYFVNSWEIISPFHLTCICAVTMSFQGREQILSKNFNRHFIWCDTCRFWPKVINVYSSKWSGETLKVVKKGFRAAVREVKWASETCL